MNAEKNEREKFKEQENIGACKLAKYKAWICFRENNSLNMLSLDEKYNQRDKHIVHRVLFIINCKFSLSSSITFV